MENPTQSTFCETHHALLFSWITKAVIERAGELDGETIIRKAVRQYGLQRGRRMAQRASANRHPLDWISYIGYGEWQAKHGEMQQAIVEKSPHVRVCVAKCPWHTAWEKTRMMPYGRFYCLEIDQALVQGFNPSLRLEVNSTRTNDAQRCEFVFRDANLTPVKSILVGYRKKVHPGKKAVLPWEYHTGHLYKSLETVIVEELGLEGQKALDAGLADFKQYWGEQAAQVVLAYRNTDFSSVPG